MRSIHRAAVLYHQSDESRIRFRAAILSSLAEKSSSHRTNRPVARPIATAISTLTIGQGLMISQEREQETERAFPCGREGWTVREESRVIATPCRPATMSSLAGLARVQDSACC